MIARLHRLAASLVALGWVAAADLAPLERAVRDAPTVDNRVALAEAYLHECLLEPSLLQWQAVLSADPAHERARAVVDRLTAQTLALDRQLDLLQALIGRGLVAGIDGLLDAAAARAATDPQRARILELRGQRSELAGEPARARERYETALRLLPTTAAAGRCAIALAGLDQEEGRSEPARRLLASVVADAEMPAQVRQRARLHLALIETEGSPNDRATALLAVPDLDEPAVRRELLAAVLDLRLGLPPGAAAAGAEAGHWSPEAVAAAAALLAAEPEVDAAAALAARLRTLAGSSQDRPTLERLQALAAGWQPTDAGLRRSAALIAADAALGLAVAAPDLAGARDALASAATAVAALPALAVAGDEIERLQGRTLLVEAQKLAALAPPALALPAVVRARDHYLARIELAPADGYAHLAGIGRMLEHLRAWDAAVDLARTIARRHPELEVGRDALLRCARLEAGPLDLPLAALDTYAEYAARYPAELAYRLQPVGDRLRRLGYASVVEFQKRNRMTPDGRFGPRSRAKLEELEAGFDAISAHDDGVVDILRGEFVHPAMFAIARRLEPAGRHRDAITAYRVFLACFPAKKESDDALFAIARLFRDDLLFDEALAAYGQLMEDYPNGDQTSLAYLESARCLENLGRWSEARERYELYAKKFPKYPFAELCHGRVAALAEILQYLDFIATNPQSPKLAEAHYQIASILAKRFANWTRAAAEFLLVAERYPTHVRAPDALYSAGTALLDVEDFPAARAAFTRLATQYPDSRLADDGQFWVGHSWEYGARALGKLDRARIVLHRRSLRSRAELRGDLDLRRAFFAAAQPVADGTALADTLGVLNEGPERDRVNAELTAAIAAYRAVVENFKTGDMAGPALLRIGAIYDTYLNDPDKGILAYQELLDHYPGSKQAVDALFQVGAYHLGKQRYAEAVKSYQQFVYTYPNEAKAEDAMLAIARAYAEAKAWDKALDAYQAYLGKFPQGRSADTARAQVEWIRMYHF